MDGGDNRTNKTNFYAELGILPGASDIEIKNAYRAQAKQYHPDVNKESNAKQRMQEINAAYEVLKDGEKREKYNQMMGFDIVSEPVM